MNEVKHNIETTKMRVNILKGKDIRFQVNLGRNKLIEFDGYIDELYPQIFTVLADIDGKETTLSYSYSDVLTKNVKFFKRKD